MRNNSDDPYILEKIKKLGKGKKIILALFILFLFFLAVGLGLLIYLINTTPEIDPNNIYSQLAKTSVIYDDKGQILKNIDSNENRNNVSIDKMPKNLVNAVISIEDKTFYKHHGFNYVRLFGAVFDSITKKAEIRGTSTITQQLARNLYLTNERSLIRKLREAYYTVQLERALTKDQIIEAYLNTIYLGFNSYGVETAAQSYFSKDVDQLTLEECATLAAIPKNPSGYAPLRRFNSLNIASDYPNIVSRSADYTIIYNNKFVDRQHQVLDLMLQQKMISSKEHDQAYGVDMKTVMKPAIKADVDAYSYFSDYLIEQVKKDLVETLNIDELTAADMLESGGLKIYSTIDVNMQKIIATEFEKNKNFPKVTGLEKDHSGNILDSEGHIILYSLSNYFDANGNFLIEPSEYSVDSDGNLTLFSGKRLNFYKTESASGTDYIIEFNNLYHVKDGVFNVINGGGIIIDSKYKSRTAEGNLVIDKSFLQDYPDFFKSNENGIYIEASHYTLKQDVVQPQAAMVITDWNTGEIKAMMGGRKLIGSRLYNRAVNTRQPGSAIKPISVYGPALEPGAGENSYWTAGSYIEDAPHYQDGKLWPQNWYPGYKGYVTLRRCVEQSINIAAVKVLNEIGVDKSVAFMKGLGITSIVKDDYNLAALGLGGMTKGISSVEMTAAYGAFPNGGLYIEPTCYTKVMDADDNVILEANAKTNQAMNKGVAYIMTDILRTTVTKGIAKGAAISGQPVAGKTGTTTDNYDVWFAGFTPQYCAALWIGNDINVELNQGSNVATRLWSTIMSQVCEGLPVGVFKEMPSNVEEKYGEYYITGTYKNRKNPYRPVEPQTTDSAITGGAVTNPGWLDGGGGTTSDGGVVNP